MKFTSRHIVLILVLLLIMLAGCAMKPTPEQMANADYGSYPSGYQELIKEYYSKQLFDPYSAVYTFGTPQRAWNGFGGHNFGYGVCGTLNAKNRMGGYVGAQTFYFLLKNGLIIKHYDGALAEGACGNLN